MPITRSAIGSATKCSQIRFQRKKERKIPTWPLSSSPWHKCLHTTHWVRDIDFVARSDSYLAIEQFTVTVTPVSSDNVLSSWYWDNSLSSWSSATSVLRVEVSAVLQISLSRFPYYCEDDPHVQTESHNEKNTTRILHVCIKVYEYIVNIYMQICMYMFACIYMYTKR